MKLATMDRSFFGTTFEEKLTTLHSLGFDALEIDGKVLVDRFAEVKQAVQATGVPISSVCNGYTGWIGDFNADKRAQAIREITPILQRTAEIGAVGLVVPAAFGMFSTKLPPFTPPRSVQEDRNVLLDSLDKLNSSAKAAGSILLLEPLNRYEDHMINRLEDAVSLIQEGNFSHVRVIADFFHMNIEEPNIAESIRNAGELIHHVHLADSNRVQPGLGHIDFASGFAALSAIHYTGYMALECGIAGEPMQANRDTVAYLRSCMPPA